MPVAGGVPSPPGCRSQIVAAAVVAFGIVTQHCAQVVLCYEIRSTSLDDFNKLILSGSRKRAKGSHGLQYRNRTRPSIVQTAATASFSRASMNRTPISNCATAICSFGEWASSMPMPSPMQGNP
jgi:hypothetical protein